MAASVNQRWLSASNPVKIAYSHVDAGQLGSGSFMRRLIERATGRPSVVVGGRHANPDVVLLSDTKSTLQLALRGATELAYRLRLLRSDAVRARSRQPQPILNHEGSPPKLWFTMENVRPPVDRADITLSFDLDPMGGTNFYVPLWWHLLDLFDQAGTNYFLGRTLRSEELLTPRVGADASQRNGFLCAFVNNPEPTRLRTLAALSEVGPIDVFGALTGRRVANKMDIASSYKFMLCFENDFYPGYVTEKPIEAWATGAVPVWWGSDPAGFLNPRAMVNLGELKTIDRLCTVVDELRADKAAWEAVASEPILLRRPTVEPVLSAIGALF